MGWLWGTREGPDLVGGLFHNIKLIKPVAYIWDIALNLYMKPKFESTLSLTLPSLSVWNYLGRFLLHTLSPPFSRWPHHCQQRPLPLALEPCFLNPLKSSTLPIWIRVMWYWLVGWSVGPPILSPFSRWLAGSLTSVAAARLALDFLQVSK